MSGTKHDPHGSPFLITDPERGDSLVARPRCTGLLPFDKLAEPTTAACNTATIVAIPGRRFVNMMWFVVVLASICFVVPPEVRSSPCDDDAPQAESRPNESATAPDVLDRLKAATLFIKVATSAGEQAGSGFLIERDETSGLVVTNAHVVTPARGSIRRVQCVLHSGTRDEAVVEATLLGMDETDDLAVLRVKHKGLPSPLDTTGEVAARETLPVLALGFPFGEALATSKRNPAITVTPTTISSIRRDDYDRIAVLQLSGGVNPGNSGGPIVTSDGRFVGVAVSKVRGADIGFAIPKWTLNDVLAGRPTHIKMTPMTERGGEKRYDLSVAFVDPRENVTAVSCLTCPADKVENKQPDANGVWHRASESMSQSELKLNGLLATGIVATSASPSKQILQIRWTRRDGVERYSAPLKLDSIATSPPATVAQRRPSSPPNPGPSPTPPNAPAYEQAGLRIMPFDVDAATLVPWLVWSRDELHGFTLSKKGLLQKFSLQDQVEVQRSDLGASCSFLGQSKLGLVVVFDASQEVCQVNEESLEVVKRVRVAGVSRVACTPASEVVYAPGGATLTAIDLGAETARPLKVEVNLVSRSQQGARFDTKFLTATPDGKYLFAEGGIEMLQRMRVSGDKVIVEEASPRIGQNAQEIVVGSDSRLVAMPSGGGNYAADGHPKVNYGTYIYSVADLQSPKLAISAGPYPRMIGFDPVARKIFAQNHQSQLIVINGGGVTEGEYALPGGTDVRRFIVHPQGHRLCVLTAARLFWVELPTATDPLVARAP